MRASVLGSGAVNPFAEFGASPGGTWKLLRTDTITATGAFSLTPPPGAKLAIGFLNGAGASGSVVSGAGSRRGGQSGDGVPFEVFLTETDTLSGVVGAGGSMPANTSASTRDAISGGDTTIALNGSQIALAKGGIGTTSGSVGTVIAPTDSNGVDLQALTRPGYGRPVVTTSTGQTAPGPYAVGAPGTMPGSAGPGSDATGIGHGGGAASPSSGVSSKGGDGARGNSVIQWWGIGQ